MTRQAYIWTREFSQKRLQQIEEVQHVWECLFGEPGDRGHYARYQWKGKGWGGYWKKREFAAVIGGVECTVHLKVVTLTEWFAREVYRRALARTRARYPNFDAHRFLDGPRAGERILEFLSEENELAWGHLWTSLCKVIEDEKPTVSETCIVEPCSTWGYPMSVAATKGYGQFAPDRRRITVVRNIKEVTDEDIDAVRACLQAGNWPELDPTPQALTFEEIRDGFIELSSPELVVLNWADARGPLSEADRELHEAAYKLDRLRVERAISLGAHLNRVDDWGNSVLTHVVDGWGDHQAHYHAPEEDLPWYCGPRPEREISMEEAIAYMELLLDHGAHPDLHGPDESPAIVRAAINRYASFVELLLRRGANAAIRWAWDYFSTEWPQAWETTTYNPSQESNPEARAVYELLLLNRPSPIYEKELEDKDKVEALQNRQTAS